MDWLRTALVSILYLSYAKCFPFLTLHEDQLARPNPAYIGRRIAIYCRIPSNDILAKESNNNQDFFREDIEKIKYVNIQYENEKRNGYQRLAGIYNNETPKIENSEKFPGITASKGGSGPDLFLRIEFTTATFHYRRYECRFHLHSKRNNYMMIQTFIDVTQKLWSIVTVNPIRIGEKMQVYCSILNIGGIDQLVGIGDKKEVHDMILSRRPTSGSKTNKQFLAKYDPHNKRIPKMHESHLKGVKYVFWRWKIRMTIASASYEDLATYICEFTYFTNDGQTSTRVFTEEAQLFDELPRLTPNLVTPNPVVIHKPMTVECSVKSIGGIDMLAGIGPNEYISNITLFQILPNKTLRIATYCALYYIYARRFLRPLPAGVKEEDLYMSGGGAGAKANLTMKVPRALIEHVTPYMCEFSYFLNINTTNWQKWTKRFTGIRPKVDKSEMMFAVGRANGKLQVSDILLAVTLGLCKLLRHL